jgi:DNA-directed RNA polymerase subunit alpha
MLAASDLQYPSITSQLVSHDETSHTFTIHPLLPGFGYTLGNSIRRFLLSSIPGVAVTRIRINNLTHEYQIIEGVVEDALDVILNIKLLCCTIKSGDDKAILKLSTNKEGAVTAQAFENNASVNITNKDLYICTLNKNHTLDIEVEVSKGVGYLHLESINLAGNINPQDMLVDALFSPVTSTSIRVEQVRVGDKTDYDKLFVDFTTDNTTDPKEIIQFILHNLIELFSKIQSSLSSSTPVLTQSVDSSKTTESHSLVESNIQLSPRIKSILEKNGITTNDVLKSRITEVQEFAGITEKALKSINDYIDELE